MCKNEKFSIHSNHWKELNWMLNIKIDTGLDKNHFHHCTNDDDGDVNKENKQWKKQNKNFFFETQMIHGKSNGVGKIIKNVSTFLCVSISLCWFRF